MKRRLHRGSYCYFALNKLFIFSPTFQKSKKNYNIQNTYPTDYAVWSETWSLTHQDESFGCLRIECLEK